MLNDLNLFKIPIEIYYKKSTMYSHWSGLIGTVAFTAMFVCVLIFFGMDFYLRENPSINIFQRNIEDYKTTFDMVKHDPKLVVGIPKEIDHIVVSAFLNYKGYSEFTKPKCTAEDLEHRVLDKEDLFNYYCFDLKTLEIEFEVGNVLILTDCFRSDLNLLTGYENLDLSRCAELTDNERVVLFQYLLPFYYPQASLNMNNYDNPISYTYHRFTGSFLENKLVGSVLQSQFLDVRDDKGWIFKDESSNYGINSSFYLENITYSGALFDYRVNLSFYDSVETHKRIYTKLQNLAAELGGFLKAILILIRLPLDFLCRQSLKSTVFKDFMTNDSVPRLRDSTNQDMRQDFSAEIIRLGRTKEKKEKKIKVVAPPQLKKRSITANLMYFKIFFWNKRIKVEDKIIQKAESFVKKVFSVDNIFKSYFELDILKRMLLSEEERKILKLARKPDIYCPESAISSRYFDEEIFNFNDLRNLEKEAVLQNASRNFEKVIRDYL